jgi:4-hydroxyphenylpyruvate dioxygenase
MKKSRLAINMVSTRHAGLEEALAAYHGAGFRNVEVVIGQVREYMKQGHTVRDVRDLLDRYRMRCIGGFDCAVACFAKGERRRENHRRIVANARLLGELGAGTMVVGTDGPEGPGGTKDPVGTIAKTFAGLARRIQRTGVTLCIEFNWSPIIKSLRTAAEIARRSGMKNVGVLFDPAHYHCTPTKFDQINAKNVPFVRHVHVDDMADKPAELSNCNSDRVLPGSGCLDLKAVFRALERHGYRGFYSIEMFNERLWAMPAARAAKLMYESLLPFCT